MTEKRKRPRLLRFCGPLEAEGEAVGIAEVELFHAVGGDGRLTDGCAAAAEFFVGPLHVRTSEIQASILVRGGTSGVRNGRALVVRFVGRVEHDLGGAELQPYPVKFVFAELRRIADDCEAENIAVEAQGGGHVVDLQERANAADFKRHDLLRKARDSFEQTDDKEMGTK